MISCVKEVKMSEKREENKNVRKHKKDPLSGIIAGIIVILLGVLFLLVTMGYLDWDNWWAYFLVGLGVILIIEAVIRYMVPIYKRPIIGRIIGGIVLIAIGACGIFDIGFYWPLILVGAGIGIIVSTLLKSRKQEEE